MSAAIGLAQHGAPPNGVRKPGAVGGALLSQGGPAQPAKKLVIKPLKGENITGQHMFVLAVHLQLAACLQFSPIHAILHACFCVAT